jgi:hypothetical protein
MKKRISKPASGTSKTSSRSGTSVKTVATDEVLCDSNAGTMAEFTAAIANLVSDMTPEQFQESLVRSGIVSSRGKLTKKYKRA